MDPFTTVPWAFLIQTLLALCLATLILGVLSARARELPGGYWSLGWTSLLMTGGFFLAAERGYPASYSLALMTNALFGPLMLLGASEFRGRGAAPRWPLFVGFGAGALRVALHSAGLETAELLHGLIVTPAFLVTSAVMCLNAPKHTPSRHAIALLLLLFAGLEVWDAWGDWSAGRNGVPWLALISIGCPLAAFQVAARFTTLQQGLHSAMEASGVAHQERDLERWRFDVVFDRVGEIVAELTEDTRIIHVNSRAKDLLGLDPANLIGKQAIGFVPETLRSVAEEAWRNHLKNGRFNTPVLFPMPNEAGEAVFLEVTVSKYESPGEGGERLLIIARDVSERHRAELLLEEKVVESKAQLSASLTRLREQDRLAAVGTLASGIAHQINNPIGGISAAAEFGLLARKDEDALEVQTRALETILEEAQRAGRIVKSVLRFARHEKTSRWREDLRTVVRRAVELGRPYVQEQGGTLELDANTDIIPIQMSSIEIEQVMVNLIRNAAESKDEGVRVQVRTWVDDGRALIEVRDDGRGIPREVKNQVFDPFFTTRLREGGSGLGLSIVHGIVSSHGGKVEIETLDAGGTCLRIDFPLSPGPLGEAEEAERAAARG